MIDLSDFFSGLFDLIADLAIHSRTVRWILLILIDTALWLLLGPTHWATASFLALTIWYAWRSFERRDPIA